MQETTEILDYNSYLITMYKSDISFFWLTEKTKKDMYEFYKYSCVLKNEDLARSLFLSKN